jgi:hypothetical protein
MGEGRQPDQMMVIEGEKAAPLGPWQAVLTASGRQSRRQQIAQFVFHLAAGAAALPVVHSASPRSRQSPPAPLERFPLELNRDSQGV